MSGRIVDIRQLKRGPLRLEGLFAPGEVDFSKDGLVQATPMEWTAVAEQAGGEIRIAGRVISKVDLPCSRCLEPARVPIDWSFDLFFMERDEMKFDEDEEVELSDEDTRTAFFTGSELPIADILREQVLLALPMKALCRSDCKGLCPKCGANMNNDSCSCTRDSFEPSHEGLAELRKKLEERSSKNAKS